ncbi:MAG: tetratricopeptide repeat protein [Gammaproteobacteria bacterium]|nr:tetratricopeptide repeat protein [Gammaproteobacteria bacterium]
MKQPTHQTRSWELAGLIAAMVIVVSLPVYYFTVVKNTEDIPVSIPEPVFVGSVECQDCHTLEYDNWEGSHHDLAMDVANEKTVLGDFDDAEFTLHGITSRFYRKDGKYFVHTNGPGGEMGDYEITHTFGWFPLQQYLIPFPGGRLQTLPIAWDSRDNEWFRVPPGGPTDPEDWLYWTNAAQTWNGMCAQCHSTNLKKNYDPSTDTYNTTWSDIDVGCEACHGPGSSHVQWAEMSEMARPGTENYELLRKTSGLNSTQLVELCAPCHSRRGTIGDDQHTEAELLNTYLPSLLEQGLYFADGQIEDEVYVYGSFTQSKMYRHDVRCSDCHEVHSIKLVKEGNDLCLQCHRAAQYDTYEHHFHKQEGEEGEPIKSADGEILFEVGTGALCVQCHMPGRYYMGVDYRPDHSFRIPDPVLAAAIDAPDSCLRCHTDKSSQWSQDSVHDWYGPGEKSHYGTILARARQGDPNAGQDLLRLTRDLLYPVNVRATALSLLENYPGAEATQAMETALMDEEALIRRTAVSSVFLPDMERLTKMIAPSLYDPVRSVRIEAASRLAGDMAKFLDEEQKKVFQAALLEYVEAMSYSADFAASRHNLGNLYSRLERPDDAVKQYEAAIQIDDQFFPAKTNLAVLYNQRGLNDEAEKLLREVMTEQPELYDVAYSLGLLLVEVQKYREAVQFLERASKGLPERARIHYNLGLLYAHMQNITAAESELRTALELEPRNLDFQYGLADHYLKRGLFEQARPIVEDMASMHPDNPIGGQMLNYIRMNTDK